MCLTTHCQQLQLKFELILTYNKAAIYNYRNLYFLCNGCHLEWRVGLSDTILKGEHPRTIPAEFCWIWVCGFRGEDLKIKTYTVRWTESDSKSSHGLWFGIVIRSRLSDIHTLGKKCSKYV